MVLLVHRVATGLNRGPCDLEAASLQPQPNVVVLSPPAPEAVRVAVDESEVVGLEGLDAAE